MTDQMSALDWRCRNYDLPGLTPGGAAPCQNFEQSGPCFCSSVSRLLRPNLNWRMWFNLGSACLLGELPLTNDVLRFGGSHHNVWSTLCAVWLSQLRGKVRNCSRWSSAPADSRSRGKMRELRRFFAGSSRYVRSQILLGGASKTNQAKAMIAVMKAS